MDSATQDRLAVHTLPQPDRWLDQLNKQTHWHSETLRLFGRSIAVPRQVAWFGDTGLCYRYSGTDHVAEGWSPVTAQLRDWLTTHTGIRYNFVLLNRYRHGDDYMGWHADDEPTLVGDVCSVSLGASRRFLLESEPGQRQRLDLTHGSILTIPRHWRHCLPRTRRPVTVRVNASFRRIRTDRGKTSECSAMHGHQ